MSKKSPEPLEKLLERFFREHGKEQRFKELKVFQLWREIVGEQVSQNAQPVSVHQGKLLILVRNSVWLQELGFQRQKLKNKLNRALGKGVIKELIFRIGELEEESKEESSNIPEIQPEREPDLDPDIQSLLLEIEDPELRTQLKELFLTILRKTPK